MCHDLTKTVDSLELKIKKLKSDRLKLVQENNRLENELKKVTNLDCENCKFLKQEQTEFEAKFEKLKKEHLVLKENDDTKRKNFINKCTSLLNENAALKTKTKNLEIALSKFSKGEKSFRMLLGNQLYANNKKGLGFRKTHINMNNNAKGGSVFPKCIKCEKIGHSYEKCQNRNNNKKFIQTWVPKGSTSNCNRFGFDKNKQIWIPKGSVVQNQNFSVTFY